MNFKEQAERGDLMMPEVELELSRLEAEVAYWRAEARRWRRHHHEVRASKRRLSEKYGAIMRRKPRALLTRLRKLPRRGYL